MTPTSTPRRLTRSAVAALAAAGLLAAGTAPAAAITWHRAGSTSFSSSAPVVTGKITASATYQTRRSWIKAYNSWNNPKASVARTSGGNVYGAQADLTFKLDGIAISVTVGYPSLSGSGTTCKGSYTSNISKVDVALSGRMCEGGSVIALTGGSYSVGGALRVGASSWRGTKLTLSA